MRKGCGLIYPVGPIIRGFWENEEMGDLVLDGVVCVVDCRNVLKVCPGVPCLREGLADEV